jgi:hypothetical protein
MILFSSRHSLKGDYYGVRDAGIRFAFSFQSNGTYTYKATQVGAAWLLAHQGRFCLEYFKPVSSVHHPRYEITFRPSHIDEMPATPYLNILRVHELPTDSVAKYNVFWPTRDNDPYILFVPCGPHKDSWMIRRTTEQ